MMEKRHFFIYPEDKNGKRTGHTICIMLGLDKDGLTRAYYGISLCSDNDQFTYTTGRELALQRAKEAEQNRLKSDV